LKLYEGLNYPYREMSRLDLDRPPALPVVSGNDDIGFAVTEIAGQTVYFQLPLNGARAGAVSMTEPGFDGCKRAVKSFSPDAITDLRPDLYFCVLTNQGRLAQLEVRGGAWMWGSGLGLYPTVWADDFTDVLHTLATAYPATPTPAEPTLVPLRPTGTANPAAPVYLAGTVRLVASSDESDTLDGSLDLDTGAIVNTRAGDIQFKHHRRFIYLLTTDGVRVGYYGEAEPDLDVCKQATGARSTPASIPSVGRGTYLCLVTNSNRVARLRIETEVGDGGIGISFLVWK
jgi:hypothetical protein